MNALAWLLTYTLPLAIAAYGTVNQGDDGPWCFSLFVLAPISSVGILVLWRRREQIDRFRWMCIIHILTIILAVRILPDYWSRVTIRRDHIGAGFHPDNVGSFEPSTWHYFWAPVMTILSILTVIIVMLAFKQRHAEQGAAPNP